MTINDADWAGLIAIRRREPDRLRAALANRPRRELLTDDRLLIVAADHSARGVLGVPEDPTAIADRRRTLEALTVALANPGVDGLLASPDIAEELALLGALDNRLVFGTMNRGGLAGARWELDDRMTAYRVDRLRELGLDGAKVLLRLADNDPSTAPTIESVAKAVDDCGRAGLPIMVEPLPFTRDSSERVVPLEGDEALMRAIGIATALGSTSTSTWLKVPTGHDMRRVMAATSLPTLLLGGNPSSDPEATYRSWSAAMEIEQIFGLVVGRSLLYPVDGDVDGAVRRAVQVVRPERRTA